MVLEGSPACAAAQKRALEKGREFRKTTSDDIFFFVSVIISHNGLKGFFHWLNDALEDPQPEPDGWIINLLQA